MKTIAPVICVLLCSTALWAQPFTTDKKLKPIQLKLNEFNPPSDPRAHGKLSITEVTQKEQTLFFFVKGVSIYSPVYVSLQSADAVSSAIDVSLHKLSWTRAERSGTTDASGHWEDQFKTENDFGVRVVAKTRPASYRLMVWVGDEPKSELPPVFRRADSPTGGNVLKENVLYIVIAGLVMLVLALLLKFKKKNI